MTSLAERISVAQSLEEAELTSLVRYDTNQWTVEFTFDDYNAIVNVKFDNGELIGQINCLRYLGESVINNSWLAYQCEMQAVEFVRRSL